jgi:type IV pilus assembly protein PilA
MQESLNRMRSRAREDRGFTMIELLVVVVIIGILVAIAIPVYLNYRKGAANKSAQSDVRSAITAVEQAYTDGSAYPADAGPSGAGPTTLDIGTQKVTVSPDNTLQYKKAADGNSYKICAHNSVGGDFYRYDSTTGGSVQKVTAANLGACVGAS